MCEYSSVRQKNCEAILVENVAGRSLFHQARAGPNRIYGSLQNISKLCVFRFIIQIRETFNQLFVGGIQIGYLREIAFGFFHGGYGC